MNCSRLSHRPSEVISNACAPFEVECLPSKRRAHCLFVEDDGQQGFVDLDSAVVLDEAEFPEFIHEEIHAGTRGADHFGKRFLGYLRKSTVRLILFAVACEQKKGSS